MTKELDDTVHEFRTRPIGRCVMCTFTGSSNRIKKGDAKAVAVIVRTGIQDDITALNDAIETLEEMGYISAASSLERFSTDLFNYRALP